MLFVVNIASNVRHSQTAAFTRQVLAFDELHFLYAALVGCKTLSWLPKSPNHLNSCC